MNTITPGSVKSPKIATGTLMLPDWEIEAGKEILTKAIEQADWQTIPVHERLGYLKGIAEKVLQSLNRAKPTKLDKFYGE